MLLNWNNSRCLQKLFFWNLKVFAACHRSYLWTPFIHIPAVCVFKMRSNNAVLLCSCLLSVYVYFTWQLQLDVFIYHKYWCLDHSNFHDLTTVINPVFLPVSRLNTQVFNHLPIDDEIFWHIMLLSELLGRKRNIFIFMSDYSTNWKVNETLFQRTCGHYCECGLKVWSHCYQLQGIGRASWSVCWIERSQDISFPLQPV